MINRIGAYDGVIRKIGPQPRTPRENLRVGPICRPPLLPLCHPEGVIDRNENIPIQFDDDYWKSHAAAMERFANFHASMDRLERLSKELTEVAYGEYLRSLENPHAIESSSL